LDVFIHGYGTGAYVTEGEQCDESLEVKMIF
jgi:hypothetical protein